MAVMIINPFAADDLQKHYTEAVNIILHRIQTVLYILRWNIATAKTPHINLLYIWPHEVHITKRCFFHSLCPDDSICICFNLVLSEELSQPKI